MRTTALAILCIMMGSLAFSQQENQLLENLMQSQPDVFGEILKKHKKYEVQIIYTQIDRDAENKPSFTSHYFNVSPEHYFYPASTVKLPVALLALEKLNKLQVEGLDKYSTMLTDSAYHGQIAVHQDPTSQSGQPNIAHYIKQILLVSDNEAYNRLYEFVGQAEINRALKEKGFAQTDIIHRLSVHASEKENRYTNPVRFVENGKEVYRQPLVYNDQALANRKKVKKGKGFMKDGELVKKPMDFTHKNKMPLAEMQAILKAVLFPESVPAHQRFDLAPEDYRFLYQYMSQLPGESSYPSYDPETYHDAYAKPLLYGNSKEPLPKHIRIFNKLGNAYGYSIDNAYVVDFKNKVEFMLSAVIHTNENQVFNDDRYEYEEIALPFMKNLGQLIYDYELKRTRTHHPDLNKFKVEYDKIVKVSEEFHENLYQNYAHYHQKSLNFQRIKRKDIEPLIEDLKDDPAFEVSTLGHSVEGRPVNLIKVGTGPVKVMLWSQMHGDEPTATRALFEIFNFLRTKDFMQKEKEEILSKTTLYIIPMLNPDGAERFQRRNALSFDLNRDALRLQAPEAVILKKARDTYNPQFGFNLHDQSKHYNVYRTGKTASISFLAPAYNYEKEVNEVRGNAMKVIVSMNEVIQQYMPGHVGKYNDSFEPRAFGDNIQKWGTSTILIESGGKIGDPEKRELVKMNFVGILQALKTIADQSYQKYNLDQYYSIPDNDRKFFDILIRNASTSLNGHNFRTDLGLFGEASSSIADKGDLSTYYGYQELDATGYTLQVGKLYPEILDSIDKISREQALQWLKEGYTTLRLHQLSPTEQAHSFPLQLVNADFTLDTVKMEVGDKAALLLLKDQQIHFTILKGKIHHWTKEINKAHETE
ncbi:serine hydrolase [Rapidithrix thailandica]|uniref:Serine hydrolase n=1 Tax=Rapidithrix thailandica TaxID=413964 RepID=A0AAW9RWP7_9BACT